MRGGAGRYADRERDNSGAEEVCAEAHTWSMTLRRSEWFPAPVSEVRDGTRGLGVTGGVLLGTLMCGDGPDQQRDQRDRNGVADECAESHRLGLPSIEPTMTA